MYCGQPVECSVDNGDAQMQSGEIQDSCAVVYKPRKLQTFAASLLVISFIRPLFTVIGAIILTSIITDPSFEVLRMIESISPSIFYLIGIGLLIRLACNKAVRVAMIGAICLQLTSLLLTILLYKFSMPVDVYNGMWFIIALAGVYCYSLVIRNSQLSSLNQGWISLLCVLMTLTVLYSVDAVWMTSFSEAVDKNYLSPYDNFRFSGCAILFGLIVEILSAICIWKLARCEAFSGEFDVEHKDDYSPLNKWMAMAIIAPFVMGLALYFYYLIPTL